MKGKVETIGNIIVNRRESSTNRKAREGTVMKSRMLFSLPAAVLSLALAPGALASTIWYVNGINGSDSDPCTTPTSACKTIGHAISLAVSGDSIVVAAATYSENLTITSSLTLIGSSAATTIIDGGARGTVIAISSATADVVISQFTIQNGKPSGIYNFGNLELIDSTVRNNVVQYQLPFGRGGGIRNVSSGVMTIRNSTIANNSVHVGCYKTFPYCVASGGGISNEGFGGQVAIINSTLTGNSVIANKGGQPLGLCGAVSTAEASTSVVIDSSTIAGNSATATGGICGGVNTAITNSIVADNVGGNCYLPIVSRGYNLSSDATCPFTGPGDLNSTDPKLGSYGAYGGPTETIPLLSGSPAIDAGNPNGCTDNRGLLLKTDQRGMPRPDREDTRGCDIGAYESQSD